MPTCNNAVCSAIGRIGCVPPSMRRNVFLATLVLSGIALVCAIASACALSTSTNTIKNVPWSVTHGSNDNGSATLYLGIKAVVTEVKVNGTKVTRTTKWDSSTCNSDYCKDCKDAATGCFTTVIIGTVTILVSMNSQYKRGFRADDNFTKFLGMLTGVISVVTLASALGSFSESCDKKLPSHMTVAGPNGNPIEVDLSSRVAAGFSLMAFACAVKALVAVAHVITPVSSAAAIAGSTLQQGMI